MPASVRHNLLLFHTEGFQSVDDWQNIRNAVAERAPDIEVRIGSNGYEDTTILEVWQSSRPSLIFSPMPLRTYWPRSGLVFAGNPNMAKTEQITRLKHAGLPTPSTFVAPVSLHDLATLGEFSVVKPPNRGKGIGVRIIRTGNVRGIASGHLVQPYIDHTENNRPTEYRVLTLFGRVLYCAKNRWVEAMEPIERIAASDGIIASNVRTMGGRHRETVQDEEVIDLAERASAAFPELALLGVDIIRERDTGQLYVLEVNPGGRVWHFSSGLSRMFHPDHVRDLYRQFGGMDRVADILIEKTRQLAHR